MSLKVTILGSSSAMPTSKRFLTAHLVNHDERFFLIDCGEGTQVQLRKYKAKLGRINHIFISHLHGDHVFGLFGLLSTFSMLGRKNTLHVYAAPLLQEILTSHFKYFNEQFDYKIEFHPLGSKKATIIYEDDKLEVKSFPLKHRIPCVGFLFKEKDKPFNIKKSAIDEYSLSIKEIVAIKNGSDLTLENGTIIPNVQLTTPPIASKSFAFCTDTKYTESVLEYINNVNLLYHEATFLTEDEKLAKATYHSTAKQAATLALKAKVEKLVIGHFSSRYKNDQMYLDEAIQVFENTILAEDGMEIIV